MMSQGESEGLRQQLALWISEADIDLAQRYALRPVQSEKLSPYRRLRRAVGRILRELGLRQAPPHEPWLPGLNHIEYSDGAGPLVIWALGMDRDTLRAACRNFKMRHAAAADFVPVLVTDVPDFAFFSRLGWLVEYVPSLSAPADAYAERKRRYLAWRYRDALAVHASAGLKEDLRMEDLPFD
jgi:hypothetical protein